MPASIAANSFAFTCHPTELRGLCGPVRRVLGEDLQRVAPERDGGSDCVVQPARNRQMGAEEWHGPSSVK